MIVRLLLEIIRFDVDAPKVTLAPLGDIQIGAAAFDERRFLRDLTRIPKDAVYIGMGDYVDSVSPSNRKILSALQAQGALYDTFWDDNNKINEQHLTSIQTHLEHTTGQWVGLLEGHHYWTFLDKAAKTYETTDQLLAYELETEFLGSAGVFEIHYGNDHVKRVHAWHGQTGGSTEAGVVNAMKKNSWARADLYLQGHTHRKFAVPGNPEILSIDPDSTSGWKQREIWYVSTGSYLRGYMRGGAPTYVEAAGLPPTQLGNVLIEFDEDGETHVHL